MRGQFDTQTKSKIVKKITKLSFTKFVEDCEIKYIREMEASNYESYAANLISTLDTDPETKARIISYLKMVPNTDSGQWNM